MDTALPGECGDELAAVVTRRQVPSFFGRQLLPI
jgi:hypothetical protein